MAALFVVVAGCGSPAPPAVPPSTGEIPQEILRDFEMQDIRDGIRAMTLKSDEGKIYDTLQQTDLDRPLVTFYKKGRLSSRLSAPQGRVFMKTHDVDAWGGVQVVSTDSSTLTTDKLHYNAQTRKIITHDHVRLEKPDSVTEGEGLETDPELKDIKIGHQTVRLKHASDH